MTLLGAALLWFGWFGFNAGSALAADGVAANAFVTTFAAPAAALAVWMVLELLKSGHSTAVGAATAIVAGLVAITPAAGFVTPLSSIAIGGLAAVASFVAIQVRARSSLDDSLDVFACHGVAGIVGAVLTGVFATTTVNPNGADGLLYGNPSLVVVQVIAVLATIAFVAVATAGVIAVVRVVAGLRVSLADELAGIDLSEHGESAYHGGDLATLPVATGRRVGESVVIPAAEVARFAATVPTK
ncbi:MAG TPA: hypothetical protein VNZ57_01755, partial [Longimicrobiales bacterium]|nr:hypothetical protein [Longimicrobiales bacterium]